MTGYKINGTGTFQGSKHAGSRTLHFVIIILIGVEEEYPKSCHSPKVRSLECGVALLTRIELWADYADLTATAFRTKRRYQRHGLLARWSKTLSISHPIHGTNLQGLVRSSDVCQSFVALRIVCWHSGSATSPIPCPSAIWARARTQNLGFRAPHGTFQIIRLFLHVLFLS